MDANNILVSIIVPSYKRHTELVKRALESLLFQTHKKIEIILVDDNAKPELLEYRNELKELVTTLNDERIIYVPNDKNLGGAGSRNNGASKANGEYLTFLDDDDRYLEYKIEKQLNFMIENKYDMTFTNLIIHNENEEIVDVRTHDDIEKYDNDYLFKYHLVKQITGTPTFMLKRSLFNKIGGFEIVKMGQEFYLMAKIIQSGAKIGNFKTCDLIAYRYDIEAISTGPNKIIGEKDLYQYKKKYFSLLNRKEKRYIRCRHLAVMAVAYKRNKKYFKALYYLGVAFLASPADAIKEYFSLKRRKKEARK